MYKIYEIVKRILDILIGIVGIIFCIPIFITISIIMKINSKGPIIYKQERIRKKWQKV